MQETQKQWAVAGTPNYFVHLYLTTGQHQYPLEFHVTADDDDGRNWVTLERAIAGDLDDPAVITDIDTRLRDLADIWNPDWLSTWKPDFVRTLREYGHQLGDAEIGWKTYLSNPIPLDTDQLAGRVRIDDGPRGGRIITVDGDAHHPDLDQALLLRRALG